MFAAICLLDLLVTYELGRGLGRGWRGGPLKSQWQCDAQQHSAVYLEATSVEGPELCLRSALGGGCQVMQPGKATKEEGHTAYNIGDGDVVCMDVVERKR